MVKKLFTLVVLALLVAGLAYAGSNVGPKAKARMLVTGDEFVAPLGVRGPLAPTGPTAAPGDSLGYTVYDYGTNGGPNHNVINFGDGTLAIGRMRSEAEDGGTPDRCTWYSYFNGTSWTPFARVETARRGWSNIERFKDAGDIEATVSHTGLRVNIDAAKGAGSWTPLVTTSTQGATWPKMAITGSSIHIIAAATGIPVFYTRSTDGGTTWDQIDSLIFSTAIDSVAADADAYDIAALGDKIVIVSAARGATSPTTADYVYIATSTDNGSTWTFEQVYEAWSLPPTGQVKYVPDGTVSLALDASGNPHVAFGTYMVNDTAGTFYSTSAPLMYWSKATGPVPIAYPPQSGELSGRDGAMPGVDGAWCTIPDISINGSTVCVVYQGAITEQDDSTNNYCHIFGVASTNGGSTWFQPVDITPGTGFDASYPSMASDFTTDLHVVYNADAIAGNWLQGTHALSRVSVRYLKVPVSTLTTVGVEPVKGEVPQKFSLAQNYPNPFNPSTKISYSIPAGTFVTLKVYDMLGREVATLVNQEQAAGTYVADFDASNLANGAYFYKIQAGSFSDIRKMMLLK